MAVPVPRTWVASEFVTATIMNADQRDTDNFQLGPPRCYAYRSAAITHQNNGNWETINLDGELYDSGGMHDPASNASRVIAPEPGIYRGTVGVAFAVSGTGNRGARVRKNAAGLVGGGTEVCIDTRPSFAGLSFHMVVPFQVQLNAGDYIEPFYYQSSGGNLAYIEAAAETYLNMIWDAKL